MVVIIFVVFVVVVVAVLVVVVVRQSAVTWVYDVVMQYLLVMYIRDAKINFISSHITIVRDEIYVSLVTNADTE